VSSCRSRLVIRRHARLSIRGGGAPDPASAFIVLHRFTHPVKL
jgi:hypothetical protein